MAIIVGIAVVLLIVVAVVLLGVFVFKAVKAPVDVTNRYIEAINDGDAQEAWSLLHPDSRFKKDYTLSSFQEEVVDPTIRLESWDANQVEVKDSRASVGVDMETAQGASFRVVFELRKDGDEWKVYDYAFSEDEL